MPDNTLFKSTRALAASCVILGFGAAASAQDTERAFQADPSEFLNSCASCHGEDGKGAGFLTRLYRGVDPGDLTQLAINNGGVFPIDRVLSVIDGRSDIEAHGDRRMPVWGDRYMDSALSLYGPNDRNELRVRNRILELAYFLQSIQER
jgi:mono/diheme cytochrome c family protein